MRSTLAHAFRRATTADLAAACAADSEAAAVGLADC